MKTDSHGKEQPTANNTALHLAPSPRRLLPSTSLYFSLPLDFTLQKSYTLGPNPKALHQL